MGFSRRTLFAAVIAATISASAPAHADSWAPRSHLIRSSDDGRFYVVVGRGGFTLAERREGAGEWTPDQVQFEQIREEHGTVTILRTGSYPVPDDGDRIVVRGPIGRDPLDAHVLIGGAGVVFFDTYARMGDGAVVTVITADGERPVDVGLADIFEPHIHASFSRSVSSIHWSTDHWVDEAAGLVGIRWGGHVFPNLFGSAPPTSGWIGVDLADGSVREVGHDVLRARVLSAPSRKAEPLLAFLLKAGGTPTTWLEALARDEAARMRLRLRAEAELRARSVDPGVNLIETTLRDSASDGSDPVGPQPGRTASSEDREAWSERRATRLVAIAMLGNAQGRKALRRLRKFAANPSEAPAAFSAIRALGPRGETKALFALLEKKSVRTGVRGAAALGIGDAGHPGVVDRLLGAVRDPSVEPDRSALVATAKLPDCVDPLRNWIGDDDARAVTLVQAVTRDPSVEILPLLSELARARRVPDATIATALQFRGDAGAEVALALLRDAVGDGAAYVKIFATAPRPGTAEVLLAVLDRIEEAGPADRTLASALRDALVGDPGALLSRLSVGHPGDATIIRALRVERDSSEEVRRAVGAAMIRHAHLEDPAFDDLLSAAARLQAVQGNHALIPVLIATTEQRHASRIASLFKREPSADQVEPLLLAMQKFHYERHACTTLARALAAHDLDEATIGGLQLLTSAGPEGAACVAALQKESPQPLLVATLSAALARGPVSQTLYGVIYALAQSEDPSAVPGLVAGLHAEHSGPARAAARGLTGLGAWGMDELVNALTTGTPHDQVLMQALRDQRGERLPAGTEAAVEAALRRVEGSEDPAAQRIVTGAKLLRRRIKRDRRR